MLSNHVGLTCVVTHALPSSRTQACGRHRCVKMDKLNITKHRDAPATFNSSGRARRPGKLGHALPPGHSNRAHGAWLRRGDVGAFNSTALFEPGATPGRLNYTLLYARGRFETGFSPKHRLLLMYMTYFARVILLSPSTYRPGTLKNQLYDSNDTSTLNLFGLETRTHSEHMKNKWQNYFMNKFKIKRPFQFEMEYGLITEDMASGTDGILYMHADAWLSPGIAAVLDPLSRSGILALESGFHGFDAEKGIMGPPNDEPLREYLRRVSPQDRGETVSRGGPNALKGWADLFFLPLAQVAHFVRKARPMYELGVFNEYAVPTIFSSLLVFNDIKQLHCMPRGLKIGAKLTLTSYPCGHAINLANASHIMAVEYLWSSRHGLWQVQVA